jgi:transcription elongation factor GreA
MINHMQFHKLRNDESREQDGEPVHLTPAGIARLEKELADLKRRVPTLAGEAARTAAYGDRSDNAEYKQAKGALRFTHRRIFEIEQQLKRAVAIPSGPSATGKIQLGSTVVLELLKNDENSRAASEKTLKKYEIVGPAETDPTHGRISHQSPLGAALISHAKDEIVEIKAANGTVQKYRVVDVR